MCVIRIGCHYIKLFYVRFDIYRLHRKIGQNVASHIWIKKIILYLVHIYIIHFFLSNWIKYENFNNFLLKRIFFHFFDFGIYLLICMNFEKIWKWINKTDCEKDPYALFGGEWKRSKANITSIKMPCYMLMICLNVCNINRGQGISQRNKIAYNRANKNFIFKCKKEREVERWRESDRKKKKTSKQKQSENGPWKSVVAT